MHYKKQMAALTLAGILAAAAPGSARAASEGDWPCVQPLVPTISAATMWEEPPLDPARADEWKSDQKISQLVQRLALRRVSMDEASSLIAEYARPLNDAERLEKIPLVFQGLLQTVNKERSAIIDSIGRFTRAQRGRADEIRKNRAALIALQASASDENKRAEIQEAIDWQTRIHRDREKSLEYVCESPTLLEQRVFQIARELQTQLP
ncbi:MAG: hypothetical protein H2045_04405 [Rhizobiales bacterium]|nr:hypothetical protein [Hyphomicrobiales bacterium]